MKSASKASRGRVAGRAARRLLRAEKKAALMRHWRGLLVAFLGIWTLILACAVLLPLSAFGRGLVVGFGLGATPLLWREFLIARGIATREMGAIAEEWTAQELRRFDSGAWFVLNDLPGPYGNIDHVMIGPSRVHVVETKWTAGDPTRPALLASAARQVEANAKTLRTHLAAQGVVDREVSPLVVVWGPDGSEMAAEPISAGTETIVVMGVHARTWRPRMEEADRGARPDRIALEALATPLPPANGRWTASRPPAPTRPPGGGGDEEVTLAIVEWKRYGKHRLYANVDGREASVGWVDVATGHLQVEDDAPPNAARDLTRARDRLRAAATSGR